MTTSTRVVDPRIEGIVVSAPQAHPTSVGDVRHIDTSPLGGLRAEVDGLLDKLCDAESTWAQWLDNVAPEHRASARNLVHYWAIRQVDLRGLQARLAMHGLSSLGRSEAHVQATGLRTEVMEKLRKLEQEKVDFEQHRVAHSAYLKQAGNKRRKAAAKTGVFR